MKRIYLVLIIVVAGGLIGFLIWVNFQAAPLSYEKAVKQSKAEVIDGIPCNEEASTIHYHVHLAFLNDGQDVVLPASIGVKEDKNCLYWLHTHEDPGIIHIESPVQRDFTLGQFFDLWGKPLTATQAGDLKVSEGTLRFYVDGQLYNGEPRSIIFKPHQLLTIEAGKEVPPPNFTFPSDL